MVPQNAKINHSQTQYLQEIKSQLMQVKKARQIYNK